MNQMQHQLNEAQTQSLTNWKNEPNVLQLREDFEMAKQSHDLQMTKIEQWNDLLHVRGRAKPPKVKGRSSVQPKLIRRQAEWRYSALTEPFLSNEKIFNVEPTTFEDADSAKQNQLLLNWQFRTKLNRVKFIDDLVRSTVDEGTCIIRLGWKRATITVKQKVPVYSYYEIETEDQANQLQQALELQQTDPHGYADQVDPLVQAAIEYYQEKGIAVYARQTGTDTVDVEKILENYPTAEVLNPQNVYIDPTCQGDMAKAMFGIVSFETCKADLLKEGKRYKNLDRVNWETATPITQPEHATKTPDTFQFKDILRKKVIAYEYWGFWDIHGTGRLVPIVATWIGQTLIRMEENPFPDEKLPFVVIPYLPVKRELYGEPDAELLEDNQAILGALTRGMIDLLGRSANSQLGFAKGMLDPLNKRKFENGQDYEFNPNQSPNQGIIEHKYPELPQSALLMLNLQNQEAEALTGVKSFSGGVSGEAYGDVAAGIRGALDAASKREMAILRRIAKGLMEVGQKIIAMNAVFLSEKEVVRVTNRKFVEIKREDIQGQFDLEVDISTAEVDDAKAKDLAFMLQTLGPNSAPELVFMILAEICELKRMPDLAEKLRNWKPQPTPEQQQLQQLEIQKAQKEVEKLDSEIELNRAKAKKEEAEADKANLDFIETETGTKHARDMEKQRGQSVGNQNLEVTKALLAKRKLANGAETKPDIEGAVGWSQLSDKLSDDNAQTVDFMPPAEPLETSVM